jgi:hypothetical protein
MIDYYVLILQNCMDLLKVESGSCSETCLTSSHDENQVVGIKVEEGSVGEGEEEEEEEEEDPLLIPLTLVETEYDVSFVCIDC